MPILSAAGEVGGRCVAAAPRRAVPVRKPKQVLRDVRSDAEVP